MTDSAKRKVFTEEFKNQLVQLYNNGKRRTDVLREYGVSASAFDNNTTGSTTEAANRTPQEQEMLQLRKGNKQLRMETWIPG